VLTTGPMGQPNHGHQGRSGLLWASPNRAEPGPPDPHKNGSWRAPSSWPLKGYPGMGQKRPQGGLVLMAQSLGASPRDKGARDALTSLRRSPLVVGQSKQDKRFSGHGWRPWGRPLVGLRWKRS
jgi:hypothetical protein